MKSADRIYFGGDYNPDQWDEQTLEEDMRLFRKAGVSLLTLPVFSWARLEPDEGVYDFAWLDRILERISANGIRFCLATPTSAQPAWLSTRYPEVLPVDIQGRKRTHGMRVFFCVNSLKYRERAGAMAHEFARRYARHPALAMWHVANEYGTSCYCPTCQARFRLFLKKRYGSLEELNRRWHTAFWGRILTSFEEICLPTELNDDYRFNPAVQLDYMRFLTDSTLECFRNEYDILKSYNPDIPVMTNMSGFIRKLDQFRFTQAMDIVGWDNYPSPGDKPHFVAMKHDIMRGLRHGQSFILTEQSPNQQNWQPYNRLKRPGEVRRLSYQALAHGADTCLFFQMRQSIAGQEKFHGAIISHAGREDTRVFREAAGLGHELEKLGSRFLEGRVEARVAVLMDWNSWWALELSSGPSRDLNYLRALSFCYRPLHDRNIPVDFLLPQAGMDLSPYALVLAPMLYMVRPGVAECVDAYVREGGHFLATVMTGLADENDRCVFGAYPGPFRDTLGIWVEETDALRPEEKNGLRMGDSLYTCGFLCDLIHVTHAKVLATYTEDFYRGMPAITRNIRGRGEAWYIGTRPEEACMDALMDRLLRHAGVHPPFRAAPGVEITRRVREEGTLFVINHNDHEAWADLGEETRTSLLDGRTVSGIIRLPAGDVGVFTDDRKDKPC